MTRPRHGGRPAAQRRTRPGRAIARLGLLAAAAWLAGCAGYAPPWAPRATATLAPTAGNATAGTVEFAQRGGRTVVVATITGLRPNAEHGFHVHERGDCSAPDAASAGGHFNPGNAPHGHPARNTRHAGDLPNLRSDASGAATLRWESDELSVRAGPGQVVGRSVVVHRDADDYSSQPAGNSGARVACGVIRAG